MAVILFFGGTSIVIAIGIATVIFGIKHHWLESKKKK